VPARNVEAGHPQGVPLRILCWDRDKTMKRTELNTELYEKVFFIREAEEKIRAYYPENGMKTPVHLSIGAEAIAAGVCQALSARDRIFGTYRSHGIYLARTGECDRFFAELYGKASGMAQGKTGSMHLSAVDEGFMGSSAIVSAIIPVALGAAFANRHKASDGVAVVFFGDGAVEEGVFWESVNAASLMRLPVLFVCEDNGLAIHARPEARQGFDSISGVVSQFRCNVFSEKSTDPETVYSLAAEAVAAIKNTRKPAFLQLKYCRYIGHVGIDEDPGEDQKSRAEYADWQKRDPVKVQREKLAALGVSEESICAIENVLREKVETGIIAAKNAPFAEKRTVIDDVYA